MGSSLVRKMLREQWKNGPRQAGIKFKDFKQETLHPEQIKKPSDLTPLEYTVVPAEKEEKK